MLLTIVNKLLKENRELAVANCLPTLPSIGPVQYECKINVNGLTF